MAKEQNIILEKTYQFAVRIIELHKTLNKMKAYSISNQILKAGTSIGANMEEAVGSYSRKEFASKVSISYKEAREARYWLMLLRDTNYITKSYAQSLLDDCMEIVKIIGSIRKTLYHETSNNS